MPVVIPNGAALPFKIFGGVKASIWSPKKSIMPSILVCAPSVGDSMGG